VARQKYHGGRAWRWKGMEEESCSPLDIQETKRERERKEPGTR
jgi:hypothetical protein